MCMVMWVVAEDMNIIPNVEGYKHTQQWLHFITLQIPKEMPFYVFRQLKSNIQMKYSDYEHDYTSTYLT